ncbi:MAG: PAS domain S-box protein [Thermodesulfobacteriota bacterium]
MSSESQKVYPFKRRSAFVTSLLLCFIVIFGMACIVAYKSYMKAIDATVRSNETRVTLLAKLILEHQRAAIGVLQSYSDQPLFVDSVRRRNFEETLKYLADLVKKNPEMDLPFLSSPDGIVWVNYPVDKQVLNKDFSYRGWYKGVKKEWKPYISSVYNLVVGEKDLAVAASAPIFDEKGKVIGILSTAQSTAFFRKIIAEAGLNLDARVTLIDQEGHIIYSNRFPYTKEIIGYPSLAFVGKALKGEKGNVEVRDSSDEDRMKYVSFAPIEGIGWSIIVEKARGQVLRSEVSYLALIGVIALLIYGFAVLSLLHLRDRHRQIKELERFNEALDGRVRERTAELEDGNKALRESEERLQQLIETSPVAIGFGDSTGRIFKANESFYRLTGYTREEIQASRLGWDRLTAPEYAELDRQIMATLAATGSAGPYEKEYIRKDGSRIPLLLSVSKLPGHDEHIAFILDITERKRAEQQIRDRENELRLVMNTVPALISYMDPEFRYRRANEGYKRWFGLAPQDMEGRHVRGVLGEASWQLVRPRLEQAMAGETVRYEEHMPYRAGGQRWVAVTLTPDRDATGRVQGLVTLVTDITERKRAEEAQRRNETRFRLLSETAGELLATDDPQRIVEKLCRNVMKHLDCHAFFNFLVDESAGRLRLNACSGIPDEEAKKIEWLDYGVAVCGCVAQGRTRIIAEDIFHVSDPRTDLVKSYGIQAYCCHPLMAQGRLIGTLSFGTKTRPHFTPEEVDLMRTVTDQVAMAMQRIQTQEALRQQALELLNLNETLEQRVKERTEELAVLSSRLVSAQEDERRRVSYDLHDNVGQALLAIQLEIERLFSSQEDWALLRSKSKSVMGAIVDTAGKIRSMQGDLWPYVLDDIGILSTIDWYCREFEKSHPGLTIESHTEFGEDEVPLSAKIVIFRILQETLSNVAKHSQASRVILWLMKKDGRMEFTVEDNGIGFDPEDTIARRASWGGLGLLSIKARAELSGGTFGVESAKGKGTTVRVSWPL